MGQRWYVVVYLNSLHTLTSGDVLAKTGEWYITANGYRFPSGEVAVIKLGKNDTFEPPEPKPTLYSEMLDQGDTQQTIYLKVKEQDYWRDDAFIEAEIKVPWESKDQVLEFKSKDGLVVLKVTLRTMLMNAW